MGLATWGTTMRPSIEMAAIARINCTGVVATAPCPMPTEMVSPAYHFCLKFRIFHSSDGMTPLASSGKINAGLLAQPQRGRVLRNAVDPQLFRQGVEENVAGLVNRLGQIDRAVAALHPASEPPAIKRRAAIAVHVQSLRDAFLPTRHRHEDLEGRAGRQLRLNGLIQQRFVRIGDQLVPLAA